VRAGFPSQTLRTTGIAPKDFIHSERIRRKVFIANENFLVFASFWLQSNQISQKELI